MRWWRRRDDGDDGDGSDGGDGGDGGDVGDVAAMAAMAAMAAKAVWQAVARAELRGEEAALRPRRSCQPSKESSQLETAAVGGVQRDRTGAAA